jgi:GH43 family beta-xylosidase
LKTGAEENIWTQEAEGTGGWRKLHNEELHNLYSTPNIIRIMGRWAGYVARMGRRRMHIGYWLESPKDIDH